MIPHRRKKLDWSRSGIPIAAGAPRAEAGTILVADADPDLRAIYCTVLRFHGYRSMEAGDGLEAIEAVRTLSPDAALLDLDLPHLSGLEAAILLKQQPATATVPLILLSVYADPLVYVRAIRAGCVGYVAKPFDPADLVTEVERVLRPAARVRAPA